MADSKQQGYPLAPATILPRSDEESARNYQSSEQAMKKKKRMKCLAYLAVFFVLQTIVIAVFSVVFLRVKSPKVRLEQVTIANIGNGNTASFSAQVTVKNTNYGRYKFDGSLATITSGNGVVLGRFAIPEARAGARSTKRMYVVGDLSPTAADSNGNLAVSVAANVRGKVELLKVMKRKKSADLFCTMTINFPNNSVQNLVCKETKARRYIDNMGEEREEEEESYLKSQKYPKSDETIKPYMNNIIPPPKRKETSNKCFVYILSLIVLLSIVFLIFGLVVLRITAPTIRLSSVTINNVSYNSSREVASLNMSVVAEIRVQNKNFGPFNFGEGSTAFLYGNTTIGVANIHGGRVGSRRHEGISVTMDVVHSNIIANFSEDFDSGSLKVMGFAELRGEIHVMNIINRRRTAVMNCSMDLNLTSQAVRNLLC
ncbi:uncharacterized protein [Henckelia pumila]|uniref:uncharacterized protein n=1 Tax=Henckelia pumila TaxID=405737 RepID=UPI003C6DFD06